MRKGRSRRRKNAARASTAPKAKATAAVTEAAAAPAASARAESKSDLREADAAPKREATLSPKLLLVDEPAESADPEPCAESVDPEPCAEASQAERATTSAAAELDASAEQEDDVSIPPAGDLDVAEQFFSEGDLSVHARDEVDDPWDEPAEADKGRARKNAPDVVERRARFAKYVKWAVGGAAVVCLAALVRTALHAPAPPTLAAAAPRGAALSALGPTAMPEAKLAAAVVTKHAPAAPAGEAPAPAVEEPAPAPAVEEPAPAAEEPAPAQAAVEPAQPEPAAPPPAPAAAAPKPAPSAKTAAQEKSAARRALERGDDASAIAAGERSVALDPTDGEAWLILGAAYQDKGKLGDAHRCYQACLDKGTRGPKGECRAMLR